MSVFRVSDRLLPRLTALAATFLATGGWAADSSEEARAERARAEFARLVLGAPPAGAARATGPVTLKSPGSRVLGPGWDSGFDAPPGGQGLSSSVNDMAVYGGDLVVGGDFVDAGAVRANRVAAWNGSSWSALGGGVNGRVFALGVVGGDLVAGGSFTFAGGVPAARVASWDGAAWSSFGPGLSGDVYAVREYQGQLAVGGAIPGGVQIWNGSSWLVPGSGLNDVVTSLEVYTSGGTTFLVAGGLFRTGPPRYLDFIARWDGATWTNVASLSSRSGADNWVATLHTRNDSLYVGGRFLNVEVAGNNPQVSAPGIALWVPNATTGRGAWQGLGSGVDGDVLGLGTLGTSLVAAGSFLTAGGTPAARVAAWNGAAWAPFGTGLGGAAYPPLGRAAQEFNAELYVGGWFTTAGGAPSSFVARWTGPAPIVHPGETSPVTSVRTLPAHGAAALSFPNPFRSGDLVAFSLASGTALNVSVYDVAGRRVATLADGSFSPGAHTVSWNGYGKAGPAPAGVYLVRLSTAQGSEARRLVWLR